MKPVVLAVDDEQEVRDLLEVSLNREGIDVRSASSLSEFRNLERDLCADLYVVDLTLPDGNGFSLVRELREKCDKGIIIVSGRSDETDSVLGLELGADDYVRKPFRTRELAARINAVLRRRSCGTKPVQTVSPQIAADSFATYAELTFGFCHAMIRPLGRERHSRRFSPVRKTGGFPNPDIHENRGEGPCSALLGPSCRTQKIHL